MLDQAVLSREDFLWLATQVANRATIPFDARLFAAAHPPPNTPAQFRCALAELGLSARRDSEPGHGAEGIGWVGWRRPAANGDVSDASACPGTHVPSRSITVVFIARDADGSARLHAPRPCEALAKVARGEGQLDLIETWVVSRPVQTATVAEATDDGSSTTATGPSPATSSPFGFRTIGRQLARHRSIWRDILLASPPSRWWGSVRHC